jgi:hypothetical protein
VLPATTRATALDEPDVTDLAGEALPDVGAAAEDEAAT